MRHGLKVILGNREVRKHMKSQQKKDSEKERDPRQWNEKKQQCGISQKPKERNFRNDMSR